MQDYKAIFEREMSSRGLVANTNIVRYAEPIYIVTKAILKDEKRPMLAQEVATKISRDYKLLDSRDALSAFLSRSIKDEPRWGISAITIEDAISKYHGNYDEVRNDSSNPNYKNSVAKNMAILYTSPRSLKKYIEERVRLERIIVAKVSF